MTLKRNVRSRFVRFIGKKLREDRTTLQVYSRDMSDLPSLVSIFFKNIPDGVILASSVEDIQTIYSIANETKTPITQRAAGTAGLGGSVTYNGGLVVDTKGFEQKFFFDPLEQTVTINPSYVFSDLQRELKLQGLSLCSYPSSYHSATIGGWIAHGGHGIGSAQYGGALEQIVELEVVLPTGHLVKYTERDHISLFVGSHGTLGTITEVTLRVKFDIPLKHQGCTFDSPEELVKGLGEIATTFPHSVWFLNPKHVESFNETFGYNLPNRYVAIISKEVSFEEEEMEFNRLFNNAIRNAGGQILDRRYTEDIWKFRFRSLSMLKHCSDYVVSEVILPIESSDKYIRKLISKFKGNIHLEGEFISPTHYALLIYVLSEEKMSSLKKTLLNLKLFKLSLKSKKVKGYPYSTGLWFSGFYGQIYGKDELRRYKEFKKSVDPKNISNPGKVLSPKFRFFPIVSLKFVVKLASRFML
ncbi:MAG: FAD-binding oxidoreductase [Candidatus Heimdallarchaeota archaeon]|nr:FAD-binding oxidoreductase [Candidatus Heimdallarchaeota archaeon]